MTSATTRGRRRLLITGASGYVGARLVGIALERGFEVVAAVRRPSTLRPRAGVAVRELDLAGEATQAGLMEGVDAVVHLAAIIAENSRPAGVAEDLNVSGTRRLLEAARNAGVRRFVFLSSQSAAADSPTNYGRSKWQIEQLLTGDGECAVRTGLVSGGAPRGVYGTLFRLIRRTPLLPVIRPGAPVYPVHIDDLCAGLLSLVDDDRESPRLTRLAAAEPLTFGGYIRMLGRNRLGRRVRLLPLPGRLILWTCRLTERLPFVPTVDAERVAGLLALKPMEVTSLPAPPSAPGLRDVARALAEEGSRRRLAAEGRTLTRYVLGGPPPAGAVRRYVRAVSAETDRVPLDLPGFAHALPCSLRALEPVGGGRGRLARRLALAMRLVEYTPGAAPVFHNYRDRSRLVAWLALGRTVVVEAALLPLRLLASAFRSRD